MEYAIGRLPRLLDQLVELQLDGLVQFQVGLEQCVVGFAYVDISQFAGECVQFGGQFVVGQDEFVDLQIAVFAQFGFSVDVGVGDALGEPIEKRLALFAVQHPFLDADVPQDFQILPGMLIVKMRTGFSMYDRWIQTL